MSFLNPGGGNSTKSTTTNYNDNSETHADTTNSNNSADDHSLNLGDNSAIQQSTSNVSQTAGGNISIDPGAIGLAKDVVARALDNTSAAIAAGAGGGGFQGLPPGTGPATDRGGGSSAPWSGKKIAMVAGGSLLGLLAVGGTVALVMRGRGRK
jgi:hypothetical protein